MSIGSYRMQASQRYLQHGGAIPAALPAQVGHSSNCTSFFLKIFCCCNPQRVQVRGSSSEDLSQASPLLKSVSIEPLNGLDSGGKSSAKVAQTYSSCMTWSPSSHVETRQLATTSSLGVSRLKEPVPIEVENAFAAAIRHRSAGKTESISPLEIAKIYAVYRQIVKNSAPSVKRLGKKKFGIARPILMCEDGCGFALMNRIGRGDARLGDGTFKSFYLGVPLHHRNMGGPSNLCAVGQASVEKVAMITRQYSDSHVKSFLRQEFDMLNSLYPLPCTVEHIGFLETKLFPL
jgi:hypothetical protein